VPSIKKKIKVYTVGFHDREEREKVKAG